MLFLTNRLNLNLEKGDKIEITVIEMPGGGVRLGVSTTARKSLVKALADVELLPAQKGNLPRGGKTDPGRRQRGTKS